MGHPEIVNTDQEVQLTSYALTSRLKKAGVRISQWMGEDAVWIIL